MSRRIYPSAGEPRLRLNSLISAAPSKTEKQIKGNPRQKELVNPGSDDVGRTLVLRDYLQVRSRRKDRVCTFGLAAVPNKAIDATTL